ncbi:hypothetical protein SCA_1510 [Staphylococcus carnosus subsp. carnosus TM300]|uniref:Uncharacterized protein n=1 Tax=Staphylococcus carnosus (strain TM300) TaxID=396513 RepID=B9DMP6_STACT|nr:hypothetical protein SCA_1510 [Staphylococcus carnosus subsp. carnosus TM300]
MYKISIKQKEGTKLNKKQHRISLIKMGIASATLAALLACGNAAQVAEKK